jgi:hypothetical protein
MYRVKYAVVIAALKELRKVTRVMLKTVSHALMNPIACEVMLQGLAMVEQEFLT